MGEDPACAGRANHRVGAAAFTRELFFGDIVVAQSRWTRERVVAAFRDAGREAPRIEVIPPPIGELRARSPDEVAEVRRALRLPGGAQVLEVYPGDLEVSQGAENAARAVATIARELPEAIVVFACRFKDSSCGTGRGAGAPEPARPGSRSLRSHGRSARVAIAGDGRAVPRGRPVGQVRICPSRLEAMRLGGSDRDVRSRSSLDLEGVLRVPVADHDALTRAKP